MPRERFANIVVVLLQTFFVNLYAALDKTQRERATRIIQQHGHLISKPDESSDDQRKVLFSTEPGYQARRLSAVIVWHDGF
jgi:hypothetical protein